MKRGREMINRIENENYERELELCLKLGGDVDKYRRLSFDALQLEQIRRGLVSRKLSGSGTVLDGNGKQTTGAGNGSEYYPL